MAVLRGARLRRPRRSLLAAAFVTLLVLVAGTAPAGARLADYGAGVRYVALGDSYSSGVGAGDVITGSAGCRRTTGGYPYLWAQQNLPDSFAFAACSGATTGDVGAGQLDALTPSTTLVSITVGGNDLGFASVMTDCVVEGTDTCVSEIDAAERTAGTQLPGRLDALYAQIRSRAPNAHVVVLGYPRFYDTSAWYCPGLSGKSRAKINEGANVLDGVIAAAAERAGFDYVDVRASFADGHEICDWGKWLHSVDWTDIDESYHPNADGYADGYLPAFAGAA